MFNQLVGLNRWVGKRMFYVTLLALIVGFSFPLSVPKWMRDMVIVFFVYMTFVTSLDIRLSDFISVLKKPGIPLWMLFLIHAVMPIVAWSVGWIFYPDDFMTRLGFLISSAIPIGVTSIVWTSLGGGNVAMALVVVTLDTLISPLILPGFFSVVIGKNIQIDYSQMIGQLIMMVAVPSLLGMGLNNLTKGKLSSFTQSVGGITAKLGVFFIVLINAWTVAPELHWSLALIKLLFVIFLLVVSGYLIGYIGSFLIREKSQETVLTMTYNVGMRNINFGFVLALAYFPVTVAIPITLASIFQQPLAALISRLYNMKHNVSVKPLSQEKGCAKV
jgi:bile acid:Na+ symporter, BASS family